jgi:DNA-binding LacI/PurR family transcriptional regulator
MEIDTEDLTKTRHLELILMKCLKEGSFNPHDRFLSERDIHLKFNFNQTAIRRALNNLTTQGHLYRINGKGTYVAPARQQTILIVSQHSLDFVNLQHSAVFNFYAGASVACERIKDRNFTCVTETSARFMNNIDHCERVYNNLCAVIFLSDADTCRKSVPYLSEKKIPYIYYGTDNSISPAEFPFTYLYSQSDIVEKGLSYLIEKKHVRIALLYSAGDPRIERYELARLWLENMKLPVKADMTWRIDYPYGEIIKSRYKLFSDFFRTHPIPRNIDAVFCMDDTLALCLIHALDILEYNKTDYPAILGVNNYPFCDEIIPRLTTVSVPFHNDACEIINRIAAVNSGAVKEFHLTSPVTIIERDST